VLVFLVGAVAASVCWIRFIVGYWPWQGRAAQRRAGW
jgi:hypothetical protein